MTFNKGSQMHSIGMGIVRPATVRAGVIRRTGAVRLLSACFLLWVAPCSRAEVRHYWVEDLGTLGGFSVSGGYGTINASGQVVGYSMTSASVRHAFRTPASGPMDGTSDLGTAMGNTSIALGINDSGQAVGYAYDPDALHAFRTAPNGLITRDSDLGTLGGSRSFGTAVNASGQAVGDSFLANGGRHAFRTQPNGKITADSDLGTLGGTYSTAYGINVLGQAVGYSHLVGDQQFHAFRTAPNGVITAASDLGVLKQGTSSRAFGINASGQVVGVSTTYLQYYDHAVRIPAGGVITDASDLGTLGGTASWGYGINDLGQVVGSSKMPGDTDEHGFVADWNGPMIDLNSRISAASGWVVYQAHGINNSGQISGTGMRDGVTHAIRLTPATPGDANGDFKVDFNDLVTLAQNYNAGGGAWTWERGDFTGDGNVDFSDLVALAQHYNAGTPEAALSTDFQAAMAAVPEPTGAALACSAAFLALARRRQRRGPERTNAR